MKKYYVEAYDEHGQQILGNLDGQGVYRCNQYKRCNWYKNLSSLKTLNNRVAYYEIVDEYARKVERVYNTTHPLFKK